MNQKFFNSVKQEIVLKKKQTKKKIRSKYIFVINPSRFLNPFIFYNVSPHLYLNEIERNIIVSLDSLSYFKKVTAIEVKKTFDQIITLTFDDHPNCVITPEDYLIERLKSFGDSDLNDWAKLLHNHSKQYKKNFQAYMKRLKDNSSSIDCLMKKNEELEEFVKGKTGLWLTYAYNENKMWAQTANITGSFLRALGYDIEKFISQCLRGGLPRIYCADVESYAPVAKSIFNKMFNFNFQKFAMTKAMNMYTAEGNFRPAVQYTGSFVIPNEDDYYLEVYHYLFYDFTDDYTIPVNDDMEIEENLEYKNFIQQEINSKKDFLKTYYGYKDPNDINPEKICKIRELI